MHHLEYCIAVFEILFLFGDLFFVFAFAFAAALGGGCPDHQALGIQVQANAQQEKQQCN